MKQQLSPILHNTIHIRCTEEPAVIAEEGQYPNPEQESGRRQADPDNRPALLRRQDGKPRDHGRGTGRVHPSS